MNPSVDERPESLLVFVLRLVAVMALVAVVPAVMPFQWMVVIHRYLGLGELVATPIVSYLARSLSAFYAFHGAMMLFISFDVRRYWGLVRFLAFLFIAMGFLLLGVDLVSRMPTYWTLGEGSATIGFGCLMLWLWHRAGRSRESA